MNSKIMGWAGAMVIISSIGLLSQTQKNRADKTATTKAEVKIEVSKEKGVSSIPKAPLKGSANYFEGLESLETKVVQYADLSNEEIQSRLKKVTSEMEAGNWIEKSNQNQLDEMGRRQLARLMQEESALRLIVLDRKVTAVERAL